MKRGWMILAPGHGVVTTPERPLEPGSWAGLCDPGDAPRIVEHVRAAVTRAGAEAASRLVFTGGMTQRAAGRRSEAAGYRDLARAAGWWGFESVEPRALLEEHARDSLENLLFGLCRYRAGTGAFPARVIVVGWAFKEARFRLHAEALGWTGGFDYLGVNDPPAEGGARDAALAGEAAKRDALAQDPLLRGAPWRRQRSERDPFHRPEPYSATVPELSPFLSHLFADGPPAPPPWAS